MKRLLDEDESLAASERGLRDLFASAEPYKADPFRKRRVLVKVLSRQGRSMPRVLKGALIAALLGATATAAAVSGGWVEELLADADTPGLEQVTAPLPAPLPARASKPPPQAPPETEEPQSEATPPPPAATQRKPNAKAAERSRRKSEEDATELLDAMRALRAERDPVRAQGLLDEYMKSHPNGVLSEDALALSIEAAAARRDPKAKDHARRYLAKFPNGKYVSLATRALAQ
jgi:hypothetical protein